MFITIANFIMVVKDFSFTIPFSEKIILNAKGSESLRTHYFFT